MGVAAAVVVLLAAAVFLAFGPPRLFAESESPEFCASCHSMKPQYEAWFHSGAHAGLRCIDCHLPNDSAGRHLVWKALTGVNDVVVFYSGRVPETIELTVRGKEWLGDNCRSCHDELMASADEDRDCMFCHRSVGHRSTGLLESRSAEEAAQARTKEERQ